MIANTVKLPVTLLEIKIESTSDDFTTNIKQKIAAKNEKVPEVFSLCDNVLLYSEKVVIPKKLQNRILRDFHTGHPGINRMKSLMRIYVYWPKRDNDIMYMIEKCKGCALAAKAPPTTFKHWPKIEQPWSMIHVDFAGPLEDFYFLIVVDSHFKWPEVLRCRRPTSGTTIGFLHEVFSRFGVIDCVVSDNGSQFTSGEFKEFCEIFQIKHITTPQYHPRSNGLAERFAGTLKRALKKASGTPTDKALQQFLQVYRITPNPNPNTPLSVSPAETMFARKIRSVFDKLLPKQNKLRKTTLVPKKSFNPREKIYFKKWERRIIKKKRIGDIVYIVEGPKYTHKRHQNQLQKRRLNDSNDVPQTRRANRHYVRFRSSPINTWKTSVREKKEIHRPVDDRPKRKKILTALLRSKRLGGGVLWEPYPSYHNGLFSPLLVLRDFAANRTIPETYYLFYATLSFLCNIICLP